MYFVCMWQKIIIVLTCHEDTYNTYICIYITKELNNFLFSFKLGLERISRMLLKSLCMVMIYKTCFEKHLCIFPHTLLLAFISLDQNIVSCTCGFLDGELLCEEWW